MADKKISALTGATTPLDGTEVLPIVQSGATVKVANNSLRPLQIQSNASSGVLQVTGPAAASTRVMTTPDASFTVARTDAGQTFSGTQSLDGAVVINDSGANVDFRVEGDTDANLIYADASADNVGFGTSVPYGKVSLSIGTTTPEGKLYYDSVNMLQITETGGRPLAGLFARRSTYSGANFYNGDLVFFNLIYDGGADYQWRERLTLIANGDLKVSTGNLVIGTSGKGIDFSAAGQAAGMTSELLADYEEGTFTPTAGIALTSATGKYTKVGRAVHFEMEVVFPVTVSTAGAGLGGLPFTISANNYPCAVWTNRGSTIFAYAVASSADVNLFNVTTGGIYDYIDFSADSVKIAGTYFV